MADIVARMPRAPQRVVLVLLGLLTALLATALGAPAAQAGASARRADDGTPLQVAITSITPGAIPRTGPITITGSVTNTDDKTWLDVGIYPFVGVTPITTEAELLAATALPAEAEVGTRILDEGAWTRVERIDPGQTVPYALTIPRADLDRKGVGAPGVYWFGVHALGPDPAGSNPVADGRARTFLPLLPRRAAPVTATVIVPLRAAITYAPDGSLAELDRWTALLEPDGRLARLADLAAEPAGHDVSWLVDPAVLAAVQKLAAGNPPRPLAPTTTTGEGGDGPSPATAERSTTADEAGGGDSPDEATQRVAALAADWWATMSATLQHADVLGLPYGDLDLSGAAAHDPGAYDLARKRSTAAFTGWGIRATAVNAPVGGSLDAGAAQLLTSVDPTTPVLVSDAVLPAGTTTALVQTGALQLIAVNAETSAGGPGPDERLGGTAVRQRILAEAGVRSLQPTDGPLVVELPTRWSVDDQAQLALGMRQPWLDLHSLSAAVLGQPTTAVDADHLRVPDSTPRALGQQSFTDAAELIRAGRTLQRVLTGNDRVADATLEEALTGLSYQRRGSPGGPAFVAQMAIDTLLRQVQVQAPRFVTLSGSSGRFFATVTNGLDQAVSVTLEPVTDAGIALTRPKPVDIAAGASATILMRAERAHVGVHNVRLVLADSEGAHFGATVSVPVRAAQVSKVIWLFIAVGCGLLFGAIGARVLRRIRRASRE